MAKELPYLASYKNVEKLFQKIEAAKKPDVITTRTLADTFGLKSTSDRQLITLLKTLGFLDQSGRPTADYDLLKNSAQAKGAIAVGVRKAYGPLFDANEKANVLSGEPLRGLIAQVTGADKGVASKIAGTFNALVRLADFNHPSVNVEEEEEIREEELDAELPDEEDRLGRSKFRPEFHYNIQVHLPANGTEETYLHIFNAIRKTFPMINEERLALFIMLGQTASAALDAAPEIAHPDSLRLSEAYELSTVMPEAVRRSADAAEAYRLFFVFEDYLRVFVFDVLSSHDKEKWWDSVPKDVRDEVARLEETEEAKSWMALGSRDKSALMTYPQLLRVIDVCWKTHFEDLLRDKALVQQARTIGHLRNTICHMSTISLEELERIRQTLRDWFRRIAP